MNMKRGLVFTLCSLAVAAMASSAMAQANVSLSLNLRYTDPANPAEGGRWFLMGKTDDAEGLAGVSAYIKNIDAASVVRGNATAAGAGVTLYPVVGPTTTGSIQSDALTNATTLTDAEDGQVVNVFWGFDLTTAITANVGRSGGPGEVPGDPLRKISSAAGVVGTSWNNSALLLSGTFGAARPVFVDDVGTLMNDTAANTLSSTIAGPNEEGVAATVFKTVRGDSLATLNLEAPGGTEGLRYGDRNRDFQVAITTDILPALGQIGQPGVKGWDDGDFNNNGTVSITQDILPALAQIGQPGMPPSVGAVPEPASIGMAFAGLLGLGLMRRRA
jgi:hypothetical protein